MINKKSVYNNYTNSNKHNNKKKLKYNQSSKKINFIGLQNPSSVPHASCINALLMVAPICVRLSRFPLVFCAEQGPPRALYFHNNSPDCGSGGEGLRHRASLGIYTDGSLLLPRLPRATGEVPAPHAAETSHQPRRRTPRLAQSRE